MMYSNTHTHTQWIVIKLSLQLKGQQGKRRGGCCVGVYGLMVFSLSSFSLLLSSLFHPQVVSWVLISPLAQAPVLVRMTSSSHTQLSANTHTHTWHPLWAIKYMTNSNPNPSGDFVHDVLMFVVVQFIWECLPNAGAVTHPACIQQ